MSLADPVTDHISRYPTLDRVRARHGRDPRCVGAYNERVGDLVAVIAPRLGVNETTIADWADGATLHDLGKLWLPPELLLKPGPLSDPDRQVVQSHAVHGYRHLIRFSRTAATMAISHHENFDGTGYPHGLKGDAIPLVGRLVRILDVYECLRSERVYKPPLSHSAAMMILIDGDDRVQPRMFDPELLSLVVEHHRDLAGALL